MSDQIPDFPQDELPEDEISKKAAPVRTPRQPRGKSIMGKLLFLILIAAILVGGILYIQQSLLELEAQAQVYALQTASALSKSSLADGTISPTLPSFPVTDTTPTLEINATPSIEIQATVTSTSQ